METKVDLPCSGVAGGSAGKRIKRGVGVASAVSVVKGVGGRRMGEGETAMLEVFALVLVLEVLAALGRAKVG